MTGENPPDLPGMSEDQDLGNYLEMLDYWTERLEQDLPDSYVADRSAKIETVEGYRSAFLEQREYLEKRIEEGNDSTGYTSDFRAETREEILPLLKKFYFEG